MTNIEMQTMNAVQSINRKMRDQHEIDWEKRTWELYKLYLAKREPIDALAIADATTKYYKDNYKKLLYDE